MLPPTLPLTLSRYLLISAFTQRLAISHDSSLTGFEVKSDVEQKNQTQHLTYSLGVVTWALTSILGRDRHSLTRTGIVALCVAL